MPADIVTVWLVRTDAPVATATELAALLDTDERARANRLGPAGRHRFMMAHGAARIVVGRCLGIAPERVRWTRGRYGKPTLAGAASGLEVNLSHADDLSAVAVSRGRPVGVDLQRVLPRLDAAAMSQRYFPAAQARFVAGTDDPAERSDRFTRLWARKEACVKAVGGRLVDGLRLPVQGDDGSPQVTTPGQPWAGLVIDDPDGGPPVRVRDLPAPPGFRAAVALLGPGPFEAAVRWWPEADAARRETEAVATRWETEADAARRETEDLASRAPDRAGLVWS